MSSVRPRGPIVIDTDVFSADLVPGSGLAERYASLITGRPAFISFQTVAELPELVTVYAQLRADCVAAGHALGQKEHTADRWIAATAIRLGIPFVSNDGLFQGAPGLQLETLLSL